jgi:dipeptidyl aminopeptidase/acylaminoacyl peptidase
MIERVMMMARTNMVRGLVGVLLMSGLTTPLAGQEVLTPELLVRLKRVSAPAVSPDGAWLVFGVRSTDLAANGGNTDLFKTAVEGGRPVRLTDWPGSESGAWWRPDGRKIGFLSGRSGTTQLWEIDPDGSGARQVSNVEGGIANFRYAPDGRHVSFTRMVKLDRTPAELYPDLPKAEARIIDGLMYRHWDSWREYTYSHLFVAEYRDGGLGEPVDVMPNERWDTPLPPFGGGEHIGWRPDGGAIAYTAKKLTGAAAARSTNSDLYLYELATRRTTNLTQPNPGYDVEPVFSPDGRYLAWLSMARDGYEADRNRLFVRELATGRAWDAAASVDGDAHSPTWSRDNRRIYFLSETDATVQLFAADLQSRSAGRITRGDHNYTDLAVAGAPRAPLVVGGRQSISAPTDLYRVDVSTGDEVRLTAFNDSLLDGVRLGEVRRRVVPATDGANVHTWVIYPPGFDSTRTYPAVLYAQGGPQSAVSQFFSYRWNFQALAANGYIVVAPNRRGVPGFGQAFKEQISGDWGGQAMRDLLRAIDDVAKEPYVDRNRLGAVGASFGGYTVYWLAGHHEGRFKTFVAHDGVFNLESMYTATEEIFFPTFDLEGPYWQRPMPPSYEAFSPHKFVDRWDTPMLVIHGERDFRVPVTEGMQAFTVLQLKGIESRFLYFPEEGHWVLSPQNSVLWHRVFYDWLGRYLKKPGA